MGFLYRVPPDASNKVRALRFKFQIVRGIVRVNIHVFVAVIEAL